ncbi:MAG: T9SS type A sorting domain-containing protein [Ignavibacteria bacterium]|nr:T9SS type A sorting domain-containing protein [Ignavibacteria bacterium]
MRKIFLLCTFCILELHSVRSHEDEIYFSFRIKNASELTQLTQLISIDNVKCDTVFAYANSTQWKVFLQKNYATKKLVHPGSAFLHEMSNVPLSTTSWDKYPTYAAYLAMMRQFADSFPNICSLDTIGYSVQGRQILAVKISDSVHQNESEPEFFYTSTMHGDETVGFVILLRLIDTILRQYENDSSQNFRMTNLVNNLEIWINPLSNPDGTYRLGGDTTVNNARRFNANGKDLNRNFPDRIFDTTSTTNGREIETRAMMQFTSQHNFILSANFHGGAQVVNYPWDNGASSGTYSACPEDAWFIELSKKYSLPNPDLMNGGFANGITNGCDWYAINGGRQDWMYWWKGGRETTIELWNAKNPQGSVLPQRWVNNQESLLAYMEEALKGIHGTIYDAQNGTPVRAKIVVQNFPTIAVYSDSLVGDFHRLIAPGNYSILVSAPNYIPDTMNNIVVVDTMSTVLQIPLQKITNDISENENFSSSFLLLQNFPNPFNPTTAIHFTLSTAALTSLKVYDILGKEVATLINRRIMNEGKHEIEFDARTVTSGIYFYRLDVTHPDNAELHFTETKKLLLLK